MVFTVKDEEIQQEEVKIEDGYKFEANWDFLSKDVLDDTFIEE